jgi:hypothetical protein
VHVRTHPLGVHDQPFEGHSRPGRSTAGERERVGDVPPLGVPRARRTLVLVRAHAANELEGRRLRTGCTGPRQRRRHGIALVGHRRRRSTVGLAHLTHLRLREQLQVERDLRADACHDRERRTELRDRNAICVPRQLRFR